MYTQLIDNVQYEVCSEVAKAWQRGAVPIFHFQKVNFQFVVY